MVSWSLIGLLVAIAVLIFAIFRKKYKGGKNLFSIRPVKDKVIQFATPHRLELVLLSLYFFAFFVSDLVANKILDKGLDYKVIFLFNIVVPAWILWQIFLIVFLIILMTLFLLSLRSKATNRFYDIIMGTIAFFAFSILIAGQIVQVSGFEPINFLGLSLSGINFYHFFGVYILMAYGAYLALTK